MTSNYERKTKKSKFTEAQIVFSIKQSETGTGEPEDLQEAGYWYSDLLPVEKEVWRLRDDRTSGTPSAQG